MIQGPAPVNGCSVVQLLPKTERNGPTMCRACRIRIWHEYQRVARGFVLDSAEGACVTTQNRLLELLLECIGHFLRIGRSFGMWRKPMRRLFCSGISSIYLPFRVFLTQAIHCFCQRFFAGGVRDD